MRIFAKYGIAENKELVYQKWAYSLVLGMCG
jgi:hypothetical protein